MPASTSARSGVAFSLERAMASPHRLAEGSRAYIGRIGPGKRRANAERGYRSILFDDGLGRDGRHVIDPGRCLQLPEKPGVGLDVDGAPVQLECQSRLASAVSGDGVGLGLRWRRIGR